MEFNEKSKQGAKKKRKKGEKKEERYISLCVLILQLVSRCSSLLVRSDTKMNHLCLALHAWKLGTSYFRIKLSLYKYFGLINTSTSSGYILLKCWKIFVWYFMDKEIFFFFFKYFWPSPSYYMIKKRANIWSLHQMALIKCFKGTRHISCNIRKYSYI